MKIRKHYTQMTDAEIKKCHFLVMQYIAENKGIELTKHAQERNEAKNINIDKYTLLESLVSGNIIEYERVNGRARIVIRFGYKDFSLSAVISDEGKIVTIWDNAENDNHATLDLNQYDAWLKI